MTSAKQKPLALVVKYPALRRSVPQEDFRGILVGTT
jgi:hypothetical protein